MARNAPWNWNEIVTNPQGKATHEFLAWLQQALTVSQLANDAVPQARLIIAGAGLTGGGDLSADRTLALDNTSPRNVDHSGVTITAGVGLSGGGTIEANRTIDLENTAVTPGSYTNTDLTVDAQGRITLAANGSGGSGSSHERARTVPAVSGFTWINQNSATATDGADSTGIFVDSVNNTGGIRALIATPPATPYTIIMRSRPVLSQTAAAYPEGFILRNSGTGRILIGGSYNNTQELVQTFSSFVGFVGNIVGPYTTFSNGLATWRKITNDGTTVTFYVSIDGNNWAQTGSTTLAAYITSADQIGFAFFVSGSRNYSMFQSWEVA